MKVAWSEPAVADLVAIHDYIARDSPQYAQRFVERLIAAAEPLETFPELGRIVPEGDGGHRELLVRSYRIIYRVVPEPPNKRSSLKGVEARRGTYLPAR
jgi:plasmid stabilization system protein ParE